MDKGRRRRAGPGRDRGQSGSVAGRRLDPVRGGSVRHGSRPRRKARSGRPGGQAFAKVRTPAVSQLTEGPADHSGGPRTRPAKLTRPRTARCGPRHRRPDRPPRADYVEPRRRPGHRHRGRAGRPGRPVRPEPHPGRPLFRPSPGPDPTCDPAWRLGCRSEGALPPPVRRRRATGGCRTNQTLWEGKPTVMVCPAVRQVR